MPKLNNNDKRSINTILGAKSGKKSQSVGATGSGGSAVLATPEVILVQAASADSENVALPNITVLDGYTVVANDSPVYLRSQTVASENGFYSVETGGILSPLAYDPLPLVCIVQNNGATQNNKLFERISDDDATDLIMIEPSGHLPFSSSNVLLYGDGSGGWAMSTSPQCDGTDLYNGAVNIFPNGIDINTVSGGEQLIATEAHIAITDATLNKSADLTKDRLEISDSGLNTTATIQDDQISVADASSNTSSSITDSDMTVADSSSSSFSKIDTAGLEIDNSVYNTDLSAVQFKMSIHAQTLVNNIIATTDGLHTQDLSGDDIIQGAQPILDDDFENWKYFINSDIETESMLEVSAQLIVRFPSASALADGFRFSFRLASGAALDMIGYAPVFRYYLGTDILNSEIYSVDTDSFIKMIHANNCADFFPTNLPSQIGYYLYDIRFQMFLHSTGGVPKDDDDLVLAVAKRQNLGDALSLHSGSFLRREYIDNINN